MAASPFPTLWRPVWAVLTTNADPTAVPEGVLELLGSNMPNTRVASSQPVSGAGT